MRVMLTCVITPPEGDVLDLLDVAFAQSYRHLDTDGDNPGFIPAIADIRRVVLPALRRGERVAVRLDHATTILAVLKAFETKVLGRFRGERNTQRAALREVDPDLLPTITKARTWAKKPTFTLSTGRTLTL